MGDIKDEDECIAVYGKFLNAYSRRKDLSVEMFIDTTLGTPVIYRNEVLTKLLTVGYDVLDNIIFGTNCNTSEYNVEWLKEWLNIDGQQGGYIILMISKLVIKGWERVEAKNLTKLTQKASRFKSLISIEKDERKANGKSLMGLLSLAVKGGDSISIIVEGTDESEAIEALTKFINNNFDDN